MTEEEIEILEENLTLNNKVDNYEQIAKVQQQEKFAVKQIKNTSSDQNLEQNKFQKLKETKSQQFHQLKQLKPKQIKIQYEQHRKSLDSTNDNYIQFINEEKQHQQHRASIGLQNLKLTNSIEQQDLIDNLLLKQQREEKRSQQIVFLKEKQLKIKERNKLLKIKVENVHQYSNAYNYSKIARQVIYTRKQLEDEILNRYNQLAMYNPEIKELKPDIYYGIFDGRGDKYVFDKSKVMSKYQYDQYILEPNKDAQKKIERSKQTTVKKPYKKLQTDATVLQPKLKPTTTKFVEAIIPTMLKKRILRDLKINEMDTITDRIIKANNDSVDEEEQANQLSLKLNEKNKQNKTYQKNQMQNEGGDKTSNDINTKNQSDLQQQNQQPKKPPQNKIENNTQVKQSNPDTKNSITLKIPNTLINQDLQSTTNIEKQNLSNTSNISDHKNNASKQTENVKLYKQIESEVNNFFKRFNVSDLKNKKLPTTTEKNDVTKMIYSHANTNPNNNQYIDENGQLNVQKIFRYLSNLYLSDFKDHDTNQIQLQEGDYQYRYPDFNKFVNLQDFNNFNDLSNIYEFISKLVVDTFVNDNQNQNSGDSAINTNVLKFVQDQLYNEDFINVFKQLQQIISTQQQPDSLDSSQHDNQHSKLQLQNNNIQQIFQFMVSQIQKKMNTIISKNIDNYKFYDKSTLESFQQKHLTKYSEQQYNKQQSKKLRLYLKNLKYDKDNINKNADIFNESKLKQEDLTKIRSFIDLMIQKGQSDAELQPEKEHSQSNDSNTQFTTQFIQNLIQKKLITDNNKLSKEEKETSTSYLNKQILGNQEYQDKINIFFSILMDNIKNDETYNQVPDTQSAKGGNNPKIQNIEQLNRNKLVNNEIEEFVNHLAQQVQNSLRQQVFRKVSGYNSFVQAAMNNNSNLYQQNNSSKNKDK